MSKMTPIQLEMLLVIYCSGEPEETCGIAKWTSESAQWARRWLRNHELVYQDFECEWHLTEKGKIFLDKILNTPMPIRINKWGYEE